jgi:CHASE2 domain-containing sensor protein
MSADEILGHELERLQQLAETGRASFWCRLRRSRAALILPIAVALLHWRDIPSRISRSALDARIAMQAHVPAALVRIVVIDDQDYTQLFDGRSPLSSPVLSRVIDAIARGRPKLIVVDIDTSDQSFRSLAAPRNAPIVWGMTDKGWKEGKFEVIQPLPGNFISPPWRLGLAEVPNDATRIVHGYWRVFPTTNGPIPSLEFAAAQAYRGEPVSGKLFRDFEKERMLDFRYVFQRITARSVLDWSQKPGWSKGVLSDRIVVLGGSFRTARDQYVTPSGVMDGVEIVAQAIEAEIANTGMPSPGPWLGVLEIIGGVVIIGVNARFSVKPALIVSLVLVPVLSALSSLFVFHDMSAWLAFIPALVIVLASELYLKAADYEQLYRTLSAFTRLKQTIRAPDSAVHTEKASRTAKSEP